MGRLFPRLSDCRGWAEGRRRGEGGAAPRGFQPGAGAGRAAGSRLGAFSAAVSAGTAAGLPDFQQRDASKFAVPQCNSSRASESLARCVSPPGEGGERGGGRPRGRRGRGTAERPGWARGALRGAGLGGSALRLRVPAEGARPVVVGAAGVCLGCSLPGGRMFENYLNRNSKNVDS